jgi:hypothetical protein
MSESTMKAENRADKMASLTKKGMSKGLRNTILGVTGTIILAEGAGAVATELTDNKPFLNNPAHTTQEGPLQKAKYDILHPLEWIKNIQKNSEISPNYDNKADSQLVQFGKNTITVSPEELSALMKNSIKPVVKGEYPDVSVLFPVKSTDNQSIKVSTFYAKSMNWMTGEDELVANGKEFTVPIKGTEFVISVENAEVFQIYPRNGYFSGAVIRFTGPDGTPYEMEIRAGGDRNPNQIAPVDIIKQTPFIGNENGTYAPGLSIAFAGIKGMKIPVNTPLIKTNVRDAVVLIRFTTLATKISNLNVSSTSVVCSNFGFIAIKNDHGNNQIVIPPSR